MLGNANALRALDRSAAQSNPLLALQLADTGAMASPSYHPRYASVRGCLCMDMGHSQSGCAGYSTHGDPLTMGSAASAWATAAVWSHAQQYCNLDTPYYNCAVYHPTSRRNTALHACRIFSPLAASTSYRATPRPPRSSASA